MTDKLNYIYDSEIFIDLYDLLSLNIECTVDEVKSSYIKLAKKHHPDQGGNSEIFQDITRAYEILYNENSRREYDLYYLKKSSNNINENNVFRLKNEFSNFLKTNTKILSEKKIDELYNEIFKDRIEHKENKIEKEELQEKINDLNLERKNIDIDVNDDRLYNMISNDDNMDINELFEFMKSSKNDSSYLSLSEIKSVDSISKYGINYSLINEEENNNSSLYSDINEENILFKNDIDKLNINEFKNWKHNKRFDKKLSINEIDDYLEKRKTEEKQILEEVKYSLSSNTKVLKINDSSKIELPEEIKNKNIIINDVCNDNTRISTDDINIIIEDKNIKEVKKSNIRKREFV